MPDQAMGQGSPQQGQEDQITTLITGIADGLGTLKQVVAQHMPDVAQALDQISKMYAQVIEKMTSGGAGGAPAPQPEAQGYQQAQGGQPQQMGRP